MLKWYIIITIFFGGFSYSCNNTGSDAEGEPEAKSSKLTGEETIKDLSQRIQEDSTNIQLYVQRAKAFAANRKYRLALYDINRVLSRDSSRASYYNLQSDIYWNLRSLTGALSALEKSKELDSTNVNTFIKLGEYYTYMGMPEKAVFNLNHALRIDKYQPEVYYWKGRNYKLTNDTVKAIDNFQTAVEIDPAFSQAYLMLAVLTKDPQRAKAYYNNAISSDPGSVEAIYSRAMYFQEIDSFELAKQDYEEILQLEPDSRRGNYNMGYISYVQNNYEDAVEFFTKAIGADKEYAMAWYGRGLAYNKLDKKRLAIVDLEKAAELAPGDTDIKEDLEAIRNE